jgi:dienelactone hydrolase
MKSKTMASIPKALVAASLILAALALQSCSYVLGDWFTAKVPIDTQVAFLAPSFETEFPASGKAPFPLAVIMPGCLGTRLNEREWVKYLNSIGWATLIVDSFTPRGLKTVEEIEPVCDGARPWGLDRAGDVVAAVTYARGLKAIDSQRVALLGWSHGGWAVMDALTFGADSRPANLDQLPDGWADGVIFAGAIYPYCGFGTRSRSSLWKTQVPVRLIMAENDQNTPLPPCLEAVAFQRNSGQDAEAIILPGVTHWFDNPGDFDLDPHVFSPEGTAKARAIFRAGLASAGSGE